MTELHDPTERLLDDRAKIIASLPTKADIFLPTGKIPLTEQVAGLRRVKALYDEFDAVHKPRLEALKDKFRDRTRAFIIGNGPSLKGTDLSLLADEITFAVNGFFLKLPELNWTPTFYMVEDHLVAEDRAAAINDLGGPIKIFPFSLAYCLEPDDQTYWIRHLPRVRFPIGFDFSTNAADRTYTGCTVTFTMMQVAHWLGFEELNLIGVDASYSKPVDAKISQEYGTGVIDMASDDVNHFHPDYFGKGFRWHDPQVDKMVEAYKEARKVTDRIGRPIRNATLGGKLEVFERVNYEELFTLDPGAFPCVELGSASGDAPLLRRLMERYPEERTVEGRPGDVRMIELNPNDRGWLQEQKAGPPAVIVPTQAWLDAVQVSGALQDWGSALAGVESVLAGDAETAHFLRDALGAHSLALPWRSPAYGWDDGATRGVRLCCHAAGAPMPADTLALVFEATAELRRRAMVTVELQDPPEGAVPAAEPGIVHAWDAPARPERAGALSLLLSPMEEDTVSHRKLFAAGYGVGEITGAVVCIGWPQTEAMKILRANAGAIHYGSNDIAGLRQLVEHLVQDPDARQVAAEHFKRGVERQSDGLMRQTLWAHIRTMSARQR